MPLLPARPGTEDIPIPEGDESPVHARAALVAREFGPMEGVLDLARAACTNLDSTDELTTTTD